MTCRRLLAAPAVAAAATLLAVTSASAAAPWTDPITIPGAGPTPGPIVITQAGHGVMAPNTYGWATVPAGGASALIPLGLDGNPTGAARGLPISQPALATYGSDRIVVAGSALATSGDHVGSVDDTSPVQVAFGSAGGDLGALKSISGSTGERFFAMASNTAGDVAIVTGDTQRRRLLVRRHGGSGAFKVLLTINVSNRARGATVGVGPKGDVVLVWEDNHHIYTRHAGPTGGLGKQFHVGDGVQSHLQAAIEANGREDVAWVSQRVDEGNADTAASVFFATAAPGHGFGAARLLEESGPTGTGRYIYDPAVRLVGGGASLLAWTGFDATIQHYVVRVAQIDGGHVGAAQTVSDAVTNAVLGDLSVDADGSAGVIWRTGIAGADGDGTAQQVRVAVRPSPSQPFGAPEVITTPSGAMLPYPPRIALAPATGAALSEVGVLGADIAASPLTVAARPAP